MEELCLVYEPWPLPTKEQLQFHPSLFGGQPMLILRDPAWTYERAILRKRIPVSSERNT